MASEQTFVVTGNDEIAKATYLLTLQGDASDITTPGQFVNVQLPGFYLRRPFSVADWADDELQLIYKVLGQGTAEMTRIEPGTQLPVLSGLGNGFSTEPSTYPLIVGGGVGVVPLFALARELVSKGQTPQVVLGFNSAEEVFFAEAMTGLGLNVTITTADGSAGVRGFVTDALPEQFDYVYACGPTPMLTALNNVAQVNGQFSLEERMGCGFGACMGCVVKTTDGVLRVCKEGPVFEREELEW